jgi:hypothetical protein
MYPEKVPTHYEVDSWGSIGDVSSVDSFCMQSKNKAPLMGAAPCLFCNHWNTSSVEFRHWQGKSAKRIVFYACHIGSPCDRWVNLAVHAIQTRNGYFVCKDTCNWKGLCPVVVPVSPTQIVDGGTVMGVVCNKRLYCVLCAVHVPGTKRPKIVVVPFHRFWKHNHQTLPESLVLTDVYFGRRQ